MKRLGGVARRIKVRPKVVGSTRRRRRRRANKRRRARQQTRARQTLLPLLFYVRRRRLRCLNYRRRRLRPSGFGGDDQFLTCSDFWRRRSRREVFWRRRSCLRGAAAAGLLHMRAPSSRLNWPADCFARAAAAPSARSEKVAKDKQAKGLLLSATAPAAAPILLISILAQTCNFRPDDAAASFFLSLSLSLFNSCVADYYWQRRHYFIIIVPKPLFRGAAPSGSQVAPVRRREIDHLLGMQLIICVGSAGRLAGASSAAAARRKLAALLRLLRPPAAPPRALRRSAKTRAF